MIDQGAMLLGPALAGVIIDWNPAYGAGFIALWNVVSLIIEISLLKQIYNSTEELQIPKDLDIEGNDQIYANRSSVRKLTSEVSFILDGQKIA